MSDESKGKLAASLAKAQGEFPSIPKDRTVTVTMKSGGKYTFAYAPLDTILRCVMPALSKNGISVVQTVEGQNVCTILSHESGESMTVAHFPMCLRDGMSAQEIGSASTYARRYSLTLALCIAAEDDDDGNHAGGNEAKPATRAVPSNGKADDKPTARDRFGVAIRKWSGITDVADLQAAGRAVAECLNLPPFKGLAVDASEWTLAAEFVEQKISQGVDFAQWSKP